MTDIRIFPATNERSSIYFGRQIKMIGFCSCDPTARRWIMSVRSTKLIPFEFLGDWIHQYIQCGSGCKYYQRTIQDSEDRSPFRYRRSNGESAFITKLRSFHLSRYVYFYCHPISLSKYTKMIRGSQIKNIRI